MSNMNQTVYEEAKRCYVCEKPGKYHSRKPAPNGNGHLEFFACETKGCRVNNNGGTWMIQIGRDGSIPVQDTANRDKTFPTLDNRMLNRASSLLDEAQSPPTKDGRPEIDNPWSPTR